MMPVRLRRKIMKKTQLVAIATLVTLSVSPCLANEVSPCNSVDATDPITRAFYDSRDRVADLVRKKNEPEALKQSKLAALAKWDQQIKQVRQEQYDETNNTRWCRAALVTHQPVTMELVSDIMFYAIVGGGTAEDKSYVKEVEYKIERDLDTNGDIVSCQCAVLTNAEKKQLVIDGLRENGQ
jgi:hypothetical protein